MPSNPLRTFTRDQVVAKIKAEPPSPYRRFYVKVSNGTWIQVPQAYTLRYLEGASGGKADTYELDAVFEQGIGFGLYIEPAGEGVSPAVVDYLGYPGDDHDHQHPDLDAAG